KMKKAAWLLLLVTGNSLVSAAQNQLSVTDSLRRDSIRRVIQAATQADYRNMLQQLKIDSTRRGPSGNPSAPNAANTNEAIASPYTSLPDPLVLKNGKKVTDAKTWWNVRRAEIIEDF